MNPFHVFIGICILSGILYRLGGAGGGAYHFLPAWLKDTKARDVGCGLCAVAAFFVLGLNHNLLSWVQWWHVLIACIISIPLQLGALSTYWDFVFGYDNHYAHGFFCALAFFPFAVITGAWIAFAIRCVALALLMGIWSKIWGWDEAEEGGRGVFHTASTYILKLIKF